jgi:hypothetical protein
MTTCGSGLSNALGAEQSTLLVEPADEFLEMLRSHAIWEAIIAASRVGTHPLRSVGSWSWLACLMTVLIVAFQAGPKSRTSSAPKSSAKWVKRDSNRSGNIKPSRVKIFDQRQSEPAVCQSQVELKELPILHYSATPARRGRGRFHSPKRPRGWNRAGRVRVLRGKAADDDAKRSRQAFRKMPSCVSAMTPSSSPLSSTIFPFTTLRMVIPVNRIFRPVSAGSDP